jgi:hypothetical protein
MAEQRHELAHVFTDPSQTVNDARGTASRAEPTQTVNDARGSATRDLNTPYTFPNYTKPQCTGVTTKEFFKPEIRFATDN